MLRNGILPDSSNMVLNSFLFLKFLGMSKADRALCWVDRYGVDAACKACLHDAGLEKHRGHRHKKDLFCLRGVELEKRDVLELILERKTPRCGKQSEVPSFLEAFDPDFEVLI